MVRSVPKVAIRSRGEPQVTQVEITRACGHVETLEVRGDPARSAYLDNARMRDCATCYRQKQTAADTQAIAEGKRCELDGSEKQVAWASGVRQRRAVEFGRAINDAAAWAKEVMAKGDPLTLAVAKARTKVVQQAISDLFLGKVTWQLLNQDGDEVEVDSGTARFWIDTRELDGSERQVAWASGVRQRRAVEFGRAINDAAAWAKEVMAKGDPLTLAVAKARTKVVQQAISDLFLGKVTWQLLNQDGDEVEVDSGTARFWIDTRELELRDFVAAMLPQFRWESYRDWEPMFRDEAEDGPIDDAEEFVAPAPAPAPAKPAPAKPAPKAGLFDDDDIPF